MSEQSQLLKEMNLEIQQERSDLHVASSMLRDRKKALKEKETEYLTLSLQEFQGKNFNKLALASENELQ